MESLPTDPTHLQAEINMLLRQLLGANVQIEAQQLLVQKDQYLVVRIQVRHPALDLILKIAGASPMDACFEQSAFLHQLVTAQTTVPMAEVIAADSTCRTWPWRYLLRVYIPGTEWGKAREKMGLQERIDAYTQIGDAVAQLHGITFSSFGDFDAAGTVLESGGYIGALHRRVARTIQSRALCMRFLELIDKHSDLFALIEDAALCHEDLHLHNWLFRIERGRWKLATILDFDKAWAGNPESDLARLEYWDNMTSGSFWTAYRHLRSVSPDYLARRPIYQLLWCLEYAKPSACDLADTNRLLVELGLPVLDHFE